MEYRAHDWLRAACCEYYRPSWPSQPFVYSDFNCFVWQRARFGLWKRRRGGKLLPQSTVKNLNLFDATYQSGVGWNFMVTKPGNTNCLKAEDSWLVTCSLRRSHATDYLHCLGSWLVTCNLRPETADAMAITYFTLKTFLYLAKKSVLVGNSFGEAGQFSPGQRQFLWRQCFPLFCEERCSHDETRNPVSWQDEPLKKYVGKKGSNTLTFKIL